MNVFSTPLISVVIPVYNGADFIAQAIQSVLDQTYGTVEVVVVDDGSKDNTWDILHAFEYDKRVKLFCHEDNANKGVSKTRMLGIRKAEGDYIAFLDADDIFSKDKLEKQFQLLKENPSVILIHSKAYFINETEDAFSNEFKLHDADKKYKLNELPSWLKYSPICNSSILVRKEFLFKVQFEFPQAFQHEDWLLLTLLSAFGDFYYCNEALVGYRYHAQSATAGLVKNTLLVYYGRIEYLLTLYLSTPENITQSVVYELKQSLISLADLYAAEDSNADEKKNNLLKELFNLDKQMMEEMMHLKKENALLKRSLLNRIAGKIRSVFNG